MKRLPIHSIMGTLCKFSLIVSAILFNGCWAKRIDDGKTAFREWAGGDPPDNVNILNGHYRRSPHFTLEYTLYLEVEAHSEWVQAYLTENHFSIDHVVPSLPDDAPVWFKPDSSMAVYSVSDEPFPPTALCFMDSLTGRTFLFEQQY